MDLLPPSKLELEVFKRAFLNNKDKEKEEEENLDKNLSKKERNKIIELKQIKEYYIGKEGPKIVKNDLIPCLLQYEEDEKISQIILIIFVDLTEELDDEVDNRKELEFSLAKLVEILIKENVIDLISRKLNSSTEEFNRMKNLREKYKQLELEEQKKKKEEKEKMQKEQEEYHKSQEVIQIKIQN